MLRQLEQSFDKALAKECASYAATPAQVDVLTVLSMNRWMGLKAIGQELRIDRSTVTKAVRGLLAKGWAIQRSNPADLRSLRFELTDDGFAATQTLLGRADATQHRVMCALTERDQNAFMSMMVAMLDAASSESP